MLLSVLSDIEHRKVGPFIFPHIQIELLFFGKWITHAGVEKEKGSVSTETIVGMKRLIHV